MVDITHKPNSLRKAVASATLTVSKQETIDAIQNKTVPKGDVFEFSRAAGLLAIKKTSDVIPDCHPLPVEFASITHHIDGLEIEIFVEVHTIYKTGVEVEAMHGAAIVALTMYDMLKPLDKEVSISNIKLLNKKGGKTDFADEASTLRCAVIVCSDSVASGKKKTKVERQY
ncbi:cyclic pyranopterin monophosphate synthase MoaC [Niabella ginsengisoli]|uniref:Cyclic pyranopterin monophosphate synthase MoaC n=1 Tax=Niabella ginsengisoli TaxID=522298 RepID=A0ABS9SJP0_9BACT|nr:cyclic pyranopterin monophosphate synthase MoaC [Niabella ginsengisoli]MCH5598562.1 cyclic pyranopterin monophosphate synthase MoaC [Niabella ginsengisoli]